MLDKNQLSIFYIINKINRHVTYFLMHVKVKNMSSFASEDKNKLKHPQPPLAESLHWCRPRLPAVVVVYFCRLFVKQDGKHAIISCPRNSHILPVHQKHKP